MSVASEITRIKNNIANAYTNAESKGATMPSVENSENLASTIASIPSGSGENKLAQLIDGSITTLTAEDFGDAVSIKDYTFRLCTNLESVVFSNNISSLGANSFEGCSKLASVAFPNSLLSISPGTFWSCSSLNNINLPNVTSIGLSAFTACISLSNITMNSIETIGTAAFSNCSALTYVNIPSSITTIRPNAFAGCSALTTIRIEATTPPTLQNTNAISSATTQIQVPMASVDAYKSATNWSAFADIIVGYTE